MALRHETTANTASPLNSASRVWIDANVGTLFAAIQSAVSVHNPADPKSLFHGLHKDEFWRLLWPQSHYLVGLRFDGYLVLIETWVGSNTEKLSSSEQRYLAGVLNRDLAKSFHEALKDDFVNEGYAWAALDTAFKKTVLENVVVIGWQVKRIQADTVGIKGATADGFADLRTLGTVIIEAADAVEVIGRDVKTLVDRSLPDPPLERRVTSADASTSQFAGIEYRARSSQYLGRTDDEAKLQPFLDPKGPLFQWLVLLGEGGVGKSRFALELCLRESPWNSGFLEIGPCQHYEHWHDWQPSRPTFIVIDYVASHPAEVGAILTTLSNRATDGTLSHPVRMLLIERDADKEWPDTDWGAKIVGGGSATALIARHYFRASAATAAGSSPPMPAFKLEHLSNDVLWTLIVEVLKAQGVDPARYARRDVLNRLQEVDRSARPLFALLTALFLADQEAEHRHDWSRDHLLDYHIRKERQRHWLPIGVTASDERLLALSCLCYGIFHSVKLDQMTDVVQSPLFQGFTFDPARYRQMVGRSRTFDGIEPEDILPPLVPDIVGEYFLLTVFRDLQTNLRQVQFAELAWSLDLRMTAVVIDRLIRDFSERHETALLLQMPPSRSSNSLLPQMLYAQVLVNRTALLDVNRLHEFPQLLTALRRLAVTHPDEPALRARLAEALVNFGIDLGKLVSTDPSRLPEALALLDELRRLAATHPNELSPREQFANALLNFGNRIGTLALADPSHFTTVFTLHEEMRRLAETYPKEPALRELFAKALFNLGNHLRTLAPADPSRLPEALTFVEQLRRLAATYPDEPAIREQLTRALVNFGNDLGTLAQADPSRLPEALALLEELRRLEATHPNEPALRADFASALFSFGIDLGTLAQTDPSRLPEALALLDELRRLAATHPNEPALRESLANALLNFGNRLRTLALSDPTHITAAFTLHEELRRLAETYPKEPALRARFAKALFNLGNHLRTLAPADPSHLPEALTFVEQLRRLEATYPDEPAIREQLARALVNFGIDFGALAQADPSRLPEALALLEELRRLEATHPNEPVVREHLARTLANLGSHLGALAQTDPSHLPEALALLQELRRLATTHADEPTLRDKLANALTNFGNHLGTLAQVDPSRLPEVLALLAELRRLGATYPNEPALRQSLAKALVNFGVDLSALGQADPSRLSESLALLEELRQLEARHSGEAALREQLAMMLCNLSVHFSRINEADESNVGRALELVNECLRLAAVDRRSAVVDHAARACLVISSVLPDEQRLLYVVNAFRFAVNEPNYVPAMRTWTQKIGMSDEAFNQMLALATSVIDSTN